MTDDATSRTPPAAEPTPDLERVHPLPEFVQVAPLPAVVPYRIVQDCSGALDYEAGADFSELYG